MPSSKHKCILMCMSTGLQALRALADDSRRRILEELRGGPVSVGKIAAGMPISQPAVSQHLAVHREAGLVESFREGRTHLNRLSRAGFIAARAYLDSFWDEALGAYAAAARSGDEEEGADHE